MSTEHRRDIIEKVGGCVLRDRNVTYGDAEDSFSIIAAYWTTHLRARGLLAAGATCAPEDVAVMLSLLKTARLARSLDHIDSWVDGAGYFVCGGGIALARKAREQTHVPDVVAGGPENKVTKFIPTQA